MVVNPDKAIDQVWTLLQHDKVYHKIHIENRLVRTHGTAPANYNIRSRAEAITTGRGG